MLEMEKRKVKIAIVANVATIIFVGSIVFFVAKLLLIATPSHRKEKGKNFKKQSMYLTGTFKKDWCYVNFMPRPYLIEDS